MTFATQVASDQVIVAGIGDMIFSRDTSKTLVAYGLGSCVGVSAWDPITRVAGLAHFMLPAGNDSGDPPVKFVEGGFERFLGAFRQRGGLPGRAEFKAAGGASMLQMLTAGLEIGRRNADAVRAASTAAGVRLTATDLGGTAGRTVQLDVATGRLLVKSLTLTTTL